MIAEGSVRAFRQLPAESRRRGLPAIGFELQLPDELEVVPNAGGATVVRCRETRAGRTIGELDIEVFPAALVIDRDGILEQKASEIVNAPAVAVMLPGASGYRAETHANDRPLPYTYVFAMESHDLGIGAGLLVTLRCARHDWPAAERALGSLQIFARKPSANDAYATGVAPVFPIIGRDDRER